MKKFEFNFLVNHFGSKGYESLSSNQYYTGDGFEPTNTFVTGPSILHLKKVYIIHTPIH